MGETIAIGSRAAACQEAVGHAVRQPIQFRVADAIFVTSIAQRPACAAAITRNASGTVSKPDDTAAPSVRKIQLRHVWH